MNIHRGDIFYVKNTGIPETGSEIRAGRPGVIVSNDKNNQYSPTVEVVFCTLKPKNPIPTHVRINSTGQLSTVLCEQVTTVSTERLGNLIGYCTPEELQRIDKAIAISLDISQMGGCSGTKEDGRCGVDPHKETIESLSKERDLYRHLYESLMRHCLDTAEPVREHGRNAGRIFKK